MLCQRAARFVLSTSKWCKAVPCRITTATEDSQFLFLPPCSFHSSRFIHNTGSSSQVPNLAVREEPKSLPPTRIKVSTEDFPFPVKYIRYTTCTDLYLHQHIETGGKKARPIGGISFNVGYIDTGFPEGAHQPGKQASFPTVLCIHGTGSNHKDLAGVITTLAAKGARVLAPNFPGNRFTRMDSDYHYEHTLIENCNFILDFLQAVNVNKLDLIVGFSAGCYPAVPIAVQSGFPVRGLALLQIPGTRVYQGIRPYWLLNTVVNLMKRRRFRRFLNPLSYHLMRLRGSFKHLEDKDLPYVMGLVATGVPFESYHKVVSELPFHRLPLLLTFSEDDQYVESEISYEFASLVGLDKERLTKYDCRGALLKRGAPLMEQDRYLKGLVFESGGHYAQRYEPTAGIMNNAVVEIFNHVMRDSLLDVVENDVVRKSITAV